MSHGINFSPAPHSAGCAPLRATRQHWTGTGPHKMSAEMQLKIYGIHYKCNQAIRNNFNNRQLYITLKLLRNSLPSSWSSRIAKTMWRIAVPSTCLNWSWGIDWTSRSRLLRRRNSEKQQSVNGKRAESFRGNTVYSTCRVWGTHSPCFSSSSWRTSCSLK